MGWFNHQVDITLSPMEVENYPQCKETTIGGTVIFGILKPRKIPLQQRLASRKRPSAA